MAFDEVRLSEEVERGARGGPGFKTNILTLSSGFEKRSQVWSKARGRWDVSYGISRRADFVGVMTHFYARRGRARGFRFKDWSDFELTQEGIGIGDGATTAFQTTKSYASGSQTYVRNIKKLASVSEVRVNGVVQVLSTDYTIDLNTGILTLNTAPTSSHVVDITGEFDVPVRYDTDQFDVTLELYDAGAIPALPIVELRVA